MNNNEKQPKNKIENILEKIQNNKIQLKSKTYFRLKLLALISVIISICIVSVFLSSFMIFNFRASGYAAIIGFGMAGWQLFFFFFPWKLFILEILLIALLEFLLRSFRFGYKIPVLYLLLGIIALAGIMGFIADKSPMHARLLQRADEHHLPPPFENLYENVRRPPPEGRGILRGTISSVNDNILTVDLDNPKDESTSTSIVVIIPGSQQETSFVAGEKIFIQGRVEDGQVQAHEIRKAKDFPPYRNNKK